MIQYIILDFLLYVMALLMHARTIYPFFSLDDPFQFSVTSPWKEISQYLLGTSPEISQSV